MARTPFKLKSGNNMAGSSFKMMGSSSPLKDGDHTVSMTEEHKKSHVVPDELKEDVKFKKSGNVDVKTLANRFSEFNIKQVEKGHPQKIVTLGEGGKKYWHWEGEEHIKHVMGLPTKGEAKAQLAKNIEQGGSWSEEELQTRRAKAALTREGFKSMSKKELLSIGTPEQKGKTWAQRLFTSRSKALTSAQLQSKRESKLGVEGVPVTREGGLEYEESLRDPVFEPITKPIVSEEEVPTLRKASGFKMSGYGKRKTKNK